MFTRHLKAMFCLFLLVGSVVHAQGKDQPSASKYDRLAKLASELDLNESQRKELLALHEKSRESMVALHKDLIVARGKLHTAMRLESTSPEELSRLNEEMLQIRVTQMRKRFDRMVAIRSILTPEQLKHFLVKMDERMERQIFKQ